MRSLALPAAVLAGALLLTGCGGGNSTDGGRPVPVDGSGDPSTSTSTSSTPTAGATTPTAAPSEPTNTTTAAPPKAQVVVVPGNYSSNPAVQGLVQSYPLYFQALVARDDSILKKSFPSFFYADTSQAIKDAQRNGWVMRPPGSVVVLGVQSQSNGTVRVKTCRSQTTQYWDPKAKAWTVPAPSGSPQVIDMIKTGVGWLPYKLASSKGVTCARVRYPA
ncbi:hypothetical protein [Kribbella steppae]|uniref:hypothetical protein n=1 Tax=Kribbella steppae TaxID=2512223 RepID=UPI001F54672D|nr:hypothetical protein [Kribbella steppae]